MGARGDALWRLWAFVWQATVGYLAMFVMATVALVFGILDVLWQLITGRDGLSSSSTVGDHIDDAFSWTAGQTVYAFTGGGDGTFRWLWTA